MAQWRSLKTRLLAIGLGCLAGGTIIGKTRAPNLVAEAVLFGSRILFAVELMIPVWCKYLCICRTCSCSNKRPRWPHIVHAPRIFGNIYVSLSRCICDPTWKIVSSWSFILSSWLTIAILSAFNGPSGARVIEVMSQGLFAINATKPL